MVKIRFIRPTRKFLFLSFLVLSIVLVAFYIYIGKDVLKALPKGSISGTRSGSTSTLKKENLENLAEAEKEQYRRLATFKAYCHDEKSSSIMNQSLAHLKSHLFFFENIETVYCYIPKTGCKTMKLLLYNLENNKTEKISEHKAGWIHGQRYKKLSHYSTEEASLRLATYKKIIVVRDPLERLASAWINKFVIMPERNGNFMWVKNLNHRLRKYKNRNITGKSDEGKKEGTFNDTKPVPFREFLFAVSNHLLENEHWLSFNRLCLPCKIDYDFIAHTDTISLDARLFIKKNNITTNEEVVPQQQVRYADDDVYSDIYSQVPIEEILALRTIFQEDFDMFGYSFEQDLAKILVGKKKG